MATMQIHEGTVAVVAQIHRGTGMYRYITIYEDTAAVAVMVQIHH